MDFPVATARGSDTVVRAAVQNRLHTEAAVEQITAEPETIAHERAVTAGEN
jgi:hypothetical protein